MTTIVYHKGTFAWDSRITAGNSITTDKGMKRFVEGGHVFYMAGCTCDWPKLRQAYLTGKNLGNLECSAFVVGPDKIPHKIATEEDGRVWRSTLEKNEPHALGSGGDHAITAIDCGLSPREAVKMAIKRDKSSGGIIRVAKL